jgi:hypothetical protein
MNSQETLAGLYREVAECYGRRGEVSLRDRFLVLAMDAAMRGGQPSEAEQMRLHLLRLNPHHMLRPFHTFAEAARTPDVQAYLEELRSSHPSAAVGSLLQSLRADANGDQRETRSILTSHQTGRSAINGQRSAPMPRGQNPEPAPLVPKAGAKSDQPSSARPTLASLQGRSPKPRKGWFGVILFVLVCLCAIAIMGYTFARPFIPAVVNGVKK